MAMHTMPAIRSQQIDVSSPQTSGLRTLVWSCSWGSSTSPESARVSQTSALWADHVVYHVRSLQLKSQLCVAAKLPRKVSVGYQTPASSPIGSWPPSDNWNLVVRGGAPAHVIYCCCWRLPVAMQSCALLCWPLDLVIGSEARR